MVEVALTPWGFKRRLKYWKRQGQERSGEEGAKALAEETA
jgi:hypothetical protein